jgi:TM2 domain-containing membrane protein YozV
MKCTNHPERDASGTCVFCGKLFCLDCLIDVKGRLYCKNDIGNVIDHEKEKNKQQNQGPMVFMNAGGGGGGSSSSSSVNGIKSGGTKSKVVAGILALFLGGIGIHKFYLGKPVQGIIYILLCWTFVPSIIAFIEGIIYLLMNEENFHKKYG